MCKEMGDLHCEVYSPLSALLGLTFPPQNEGGKGVVR